MLVHNSYDSDWLVDQNFPNGRTIHHSYDLSKNEKYADRVLVTDSVSYVYKRMH
jgi:hypothetical protein